MDDKLERLLAYWRSKRRARKMPARADIDPAEIPELLPFISLFDHEDRRFRIRLAGHKIVEAYGVEPRGKYLDELMPKGRAELALRAYRAVVEHCRPVLARTNMITPRGTEFPLTRLLLPLSGKDDTVHFILAGVLVGRWNDFELAPLGQGTTASAASTLLEII